MKTHFVFLSLLLIPAEIGAQPSSPVRDPWHGFGLGSTVQMRTRVEIDGKTVSDELKSCKVQSVRAGGSAGILTRTVADGKPRVHTSYHIHGRDPEKLGLVLQLKKDATLTIDGKTLPVTVRHWVSAKDKKDLEKIAKPVPDILKQGGLRGVQNVDVSLTFYEAQSPDVEIPYHEIQTPGLDLSVGPRVLKAEFRLAWLGDDGKPIAENTFVETVKKLTAELDIKGKKARCVVFDVAGSQSEKNQPKPWLAHGEIWYSNDVPGREVKKELLSDTPKGKAKQSMVAEEFAVQPDAPKLDLAKLVADKQRPRIPDPRWNEMRLGAWVASVHQIVDRGAKQPREFEVALLQVVQIQKTGAYVTVAKKLADQGWQETGHDLVEAPEPAANAEGDEVVREELLLLGEKIACEKRTRTEKGFSSTSTISRWLPLDDKRKQWLADAGLGHMKETQAQVIKDSFSEHTMKSEGVITSAGVGTSVGGKEIACVRFKSMHWEGMKPWYVDHTYHSKSVPRGPVAVIHVGNRDWSFSHVLDFGEADKPPPDLEQLRGYYRQAAQLLKSVDLNTVE